MKKLLLLLPASFLAFSIHAQINRIGQKDQGNRNKPITIGTRPLPTPQPPGTTTAPSSQPAEKPLALFLTDVTVTATKTGTDTYNLQIEYTIMNVDTAAISLGNFGVQGAVAVEGRPPFTGACGERAGLAYQTLNPGAKITGSFFCTNKQLVGTGRGVYDLGITPSPGFKIADPTKAGKRVFFTL